MKQFSFKKFIYVFFGLILSPITLIIAVILSMGNDKTETTVWMTTFSKED